MEELLTIVGLLGLVALYFLPYIAARSNKHKNCEAIGALNLLLGWTLIGWICAFIWAYVNPIDKNIVENKESKLCAECGKYYENSPKFCPNCGKEIKK